MSRSLKKGPYINEKLLKKISQLKAADKTIVKTWDRASTITPEMVGFKIGVHNGREHITVDIIENMVGHKLGEFATTRKFVVHGGKMAKEQQKGPETSAAPAPAATKK
jgi:small subunit ribosomal protein S19